MDINYMDPNDEKVERHVFRALAFLCNGIPNRVVTTNSIRNLAKFTMRRQKPGPHINTAIEDCLDHLAFTGVIKQNGSERFSLTKAFSDWDIRQKPKSEGGLAKNTRKNKIKRMINGRNARTLNDNIVETKKKYQVKKRKQNASGDSSPTTAQFQVNNNMIDKRIFEGLSPEEGDYRRSISHPTDKNELGDYNINDVLNNLDHPHNVKLDKNKGCDVELPGVVETTQYVDNSMQTEAADKPATSKKFKWLFF